MNSRKTEEILHSKIIGLLILIFCQSSMLSQIKAPRIYTEYYFEKKSDSLIKTQTHKIIPLQYQNAILAALMHYPELQETKIIFKRKKIKSTMAARPKGLHLFRRKTKRKYLVLINDFPSADIPADTIPFNALVGVFGHELAHIQEYEQKSSFSILKIGLKYGDEKFKTSFERATDQRTINHGLLWQCYDFATFAFHYKGASLKYLEHKKRTYMHPEEIKSQNNSSKK